MAVEEVRRGEPVVDERAGRRALLDATPVLLHPLLLRLERREVHTERAHASIGRIELGSTLADESRLDQSGGLVRSDDLVIGLQCKNLQQIARNPSVDHLLLIHVVAGEFVGFGGSDCSANRIDPTDPFVWRR